MEQELSRADNLVPAPDAAPVVPVANLSRGRRAWRWAKRVALAILVIGLTYLIIAPTGRYLLRAAWEEGKILARRHAITDIVNDPATRAGVRAKLQLVLAARVFAMDSVKLRAGESFTTYSQLRSDTLVLVLSGAYRDRLKAYTWWFPVVGRVPYKGFFDFGAAKDAERALEARGFDAYVRPSPAFSTLGWFNDPLLSTSLRSDSIDLANTVIHELTHNTFYAPGQAVFNESFANFVGSRGSAWFFRVRGDTASAAESDARWADEKVMGRFWAQLYHSIDSAYKSHPGENADSVRVRIAARDTVYARARTQLVQVLGPQLRTIGPRVLERMRLDNAALMARRIYLTDLDLFDGVYSRERCDLRAAMQQIVDLAKSNKKKPYDALRSWIAQHPSPSPDDCAAL